MLLRRLVMLSWLVMLWDRNMHIWYMHIRNVDVGHMHRRNLDLMMAAIMTMAWWWCASFLSSHSFNSFRKNLRHYFSLPPPNIVLGTVGPHAVLSNRPCRVAHIALGTVRA